MSESAPILHRTIEQALSWGPVVRGVRWGEGELCVLFLHEPGTDLDAWGTLPRDIARASYGIRVGDAALAARALTPGRHHAQRAPGTRPTAVREGGADVERGARMGGLSGKEQMDSVLAIETRAFDLPGHGLSDGPWLPERLPDLIRELVASQEATSRTIVVAADESSLAALALTAEVDLAGLVCLSPSEEPEVEMPRSPRVPKHFFAGAQAGDDLDSARRLASACGGWAVVTAVPVAARGTGLLATDWGGRIADAIAGVVGDCLRPRSHFGASVRGSVSDRQIAP